MQEMIVVGLGELGQLYASAALKLGLRVTPLLRKSPREDALSGVSETAPVLVAVGENDLNQALSSLPAQRLAQLILLQNELFPSTWRAFTPNPTVMVPWLLKKKGEPLLVARSTPVFGQHAELVEKLHVALGFQAERLPTAVALHQAIVDKYAFILTVNALGLIRDVTLGEWLSQGPEQVDAFAREAALLGERLVGQPVDLTQTLREVRSGFQHMGGMRARGRTAKARVLRAVEHATSFSFETPALQRLSAAP